MSSQDEGLAHLLEAFQAEAAGARHVLALSRDGLKICRSPGLDADRADQLAAIASGIQSLAVSASAEFGRGIGAGQALVEFPGGMLLVVPAGDGANLAVVADADADVGRVVHAMNDLVARLGARLSAAPRRP
ncbi:roadblock/LC7 domain-containing protein [Actinomadura namibiensis]|uniref:Putative regulator of Ras-like GTPase activity (Roadblock/LC7/MglB family) n=1 Tax=Actinomadura namibiensis TaxID=182080 RepID=A0A7W3LMW9_ACTNM|nr:roadblock/LC7 domain-containing protein [Actinomadura namibiensis]MBA8951076.1 putative regulator of Ras-like GTPase activity (Roadblock/LC7/MglB family) [Actinomadura namibiensis]